MLRGLTTVSFFAGGLTAARSRRTEVPGVVDSRFAAHGRTEAGA
ncbi:hypothetical protein [Planomonospora sp. ID67723]|nr:hypothetical protein [Planomonospora sp. ID67723]